MIFFHGESESVWVSIWFLQMCGMLSKRFTPILHHPEYWSMVYNWGAGRGLGEQQSGPTESFKGMQMLLFHELHQEAYLRGSEEYLTCGFPNWPSHPQCSIYLTHTHSPCELLVHMKMASMNLYRWLVSIHKKPAQLCGIERKHANKHSALPSRKHIAGTWPGFAGLREGIKS